MIQVFRKHIRLRLRGRLGQTSVETALLIALGIVGLVAMSFYVNMTIKGNIFGGSQAVGLQYDSRDYHHETQTIDNMFQEVHTVPMWGMVGLDMIPAERSGIADPRYYKRRYRILESLPTGPIYREPARETSETDANWKVSSEASYADRR